MEFAAFIIFASDSQWVGMSCMTACIGRIPILSFSFRLPVTVYTLHGVIAIAIMNLHRART